ncbi:MAG: helix-turn-helix transcriptional regulator [Solirubrobacterales bacterium]
MNGASQEFAEQFGANLLRLRRRAGLSQEDLCARSGLHRTEIGLLENARRVPRGDTIAKLAGSLGVDPADLFTDISWVPALDRPAGNIWTRLASVRQAQDRAKARKPAADGH